MVKKIQSPSSHMLAEGCSTANASCKQSHGAKATYIMQSNSIIRTDSI